MLNREEIEKLIQEIKLVDGYMDAAVQLTPNGFDLTAASIFEFIGQGSVDFSNKERQLPECREVEAQKASPQDKFGWWHLRPGVYKVKTNEAVNLPQDLIALAFTRTSLLRAGAFTQHGVWDAGFKGKGEFILSVQNPAGLKLKQNARVAQLVFLKINETNHSYKGIYQNLV
ncbi:MAG: deoxyuridine 5'-triphosphate nucleotidohydrolase [Candidatus Omnitrophota bacterium]